MSATTLEHGLKDFLVPNQKGWCWRQAGAKYRVKAIVGSQELGFWYANAEAVPSIA
ncbi:MULTISPECIES: hypothetical protein [unclassified Methylobacterium]|uniref:hypothetical protein n=1 Tax=unclassified Methylobacterium TaxID=2615210 RepID=UPI0012E35404|nr:MULTISPECIES: hypothetical protein [unclassified Methylobacterium]